MEHHTNLKTTSGSRSGLDKSIQPKKQAQKSHATVPLSLHDARVSPHEIKPTLHVLIE